MKEKIIEIAIPSLVTIIGFWINYRLLKREKTLEAYNYKGEERIKIMIDIPQKILQYIEYYMLLTAGKNIDRKEFEDVKQRIFNTVLCYGSEDAVKILVYFENLFFCGVDDGSPTAPIQIIAPLVLLLMQIKYDITSIKTSPKVWYVKFSSQTMMETGFYEKSIEEINKIVDNLGLNNFLKMSNLKLY